MSVPSSPFSSPINKPFLPASKSPSNSILSPKPMPAPSTPTSFRIASSSSEDLQESVQVTRPLRRSSSTSRIIPTLNPDNIPAGAVLKRTSSLSRGRCLTVKTVASDFDMNASTADTATNTVVETKPLLADSSSSPRTNFFTDATTETDLNITSFEVLIQKQQELIESLLTDQTPPDNFASPVTIEPTQSLTDMAVRYASLEEERILLTEAAMEIGEARVALKKERDEFLDEVRAFRTLQMKTSNPSAP
ncbi:hypothetical protein BC830DRAFT_682982 [Chytriomyces sp. MP71]|nr:hypothetical protein BC830DRAFT_682982 [Chytriomyces sp. MP71]